MTDKPQKTVFVLGAGASAASDFHLPVMNDFMNQLNDVRGDYPDLCTYLQKTYRMRTFSGINLEDVFTQLELDIDGYASVRGLPIEELLPVKRQLLDYTRSVLCGVKTACPKHQKLLCSSGRNLPQDYSHTEVSLNYDLIADRSLYQDPNNEWKISNMGRMLWPGLAPAAYDDTNSFDPEREQQGLFLKLHGSINWTFCPKVDCPNHFHFFPNLLEIKSADSSNEDGNGRPCSLCGTTIEWVLVPPTMKKSFEQFPQLGLIWRLAYEELKAADRVVFLGVSLAPSDYYLHWLIRSSLVYRDPRPEVIVINPCEEAVRRTAQLTGVQPIQYERVEEYLDKRDA